MKLLNMIITLAIVTACRNNEADMIKPADPVIVDTTVKGDFTYLALGDSYTIGEDVKESSNFPNQLSVKLSSPGHAITKPEIIARTGWTTDELKAAIKERNLQGKYDVVTLLIGVNNQYRGYNIDTYRKEFVELLNTALNYTGGDKKHVFILSIPDYSVTPFAASSDKGKIAREIDQYNAINREETLKAGFSYTDITPISRGAVTDASLIADDGLHPSAKMYAAWVNLLAPKVASQLNH